VYSFAPAAIEALVGFWGLGSFAASACLCGPASCVAAGGEL
jgi:hypothetical protein